jgi:hypothetical protein
VGATGIPQIVLALSARGLATEEISAHFAEVYGASVSREMVSKITDQVLEEMIARPIAKHGGYQLACSERPGFQDAIWIGLARCPRR